MTWVIVMLGCNGLEINIEHFSLSRCCLHITHLYELITFH
jgi:hypothetical protein